MDKIGPAMTVGGFREKMIKKLGKLKLKASGGGADDEDDDDIYAQVDAQVDAQVAKPKSPKPPFVSSASAAAGARSSFGSGRMSSGINRK